MDLNHVTQTIADLLTNEQQRGPVRGMDDLLIRRAQRSTIKEQLRILEQEIKTLRERAGTLPGLPPLEIIRWAQTVQAMSNMVFLEVDTTGLDVHAEIIRVTVLDCQGETLLDRFITPSRPISSATSTLTGISPQQLAAYGKPFTDVYTALQDTLRGKYVLSYNLDFDRGKLQEAAHRYALEALPLIGECLMQRAMQYYRLTSYPKLESLCERVGATLPGHPNQTAFHRAAGQRSLLQAIASVVTDVTSTPTPVGDAGSDGDLDGLDENPF